MAPAQPSSTRPPQRPPPTALDPSAHLREVPAHRSQRERIRDRAVAMAASLDRSAALTRATLEARSREALVELGLGEEFLGWTMVALATAFWRRHVETVPPDRRLLLLPHCLRKADSCPAKYDEVGLLCEDCGACRLSELRTEAQGQGYRVLIAEGSPTVLQMVLRGQADAILGAACLHSLEKSFEKILLAGIPCMAVPLLGNTCRDTATDLDWVREMIATPYRPGPSDSRTYVRLLRSAVAMFEPETFARLAPRRRRAAAESNGRGLSGLDPISATESVALGFVLEGGKRFRPFVALAAYDALTGGATTRGDSRPAFLPEPVQRVALAIEVFHKASLVHDDIEDDDAERYGEPTLHRRHGTSIALNVGDYLIGLGYRLVAEQRSTLGADAVADVLATLADAHTRLCEGQGAELAWRDARDKRLAPLEALSIYALKTAPAFEAALWSGIRLAGPRPELREPVARFARHLGVAYQTLDDLDDWRSAGDEPEGTDVLGGRPTLLWALALEGLDEPGRQALEAAAAEPGPAGAKLARVRELYERAGVFDRARSLIAKHRERAHAIAAGVPGELARLLHYLADALLP